jgi:hypothetical protein
MRTVNLFVYLIGFLSFLFFSCQKEASSRSTSNTMATKSEHQNFDKLTDSIETLIAKENISPRVIEEKMEDASVIRKGFYYNKDLLKMEIVRVYKKDTYKETYYFKNHKLVSAHMETEQLMENVKLKELSEKRYYFRQERIFKAIHRRTQLNANQNGSLDNIPFEEDVTNLDQMNREIQEKVHTYSEVLK